MNKARTIETFVCIAVLVAVLFVGVWQIKPAYATTFLDSGWENSGGSDLTDGGKWSDKVGSPSVDSGTVHAGLYSCKIGVTYSDYAVFYNFSATRTEVWFRFYWQTDGLPTSDGDDYYVASVYHDGFPTGGLLMRVDIVNDSGAVKWNVNYRNNDAYSSVVNATAAPSASIWYPLELHILVNNGAGLVDFWVNGDKEVAVSSLQNTVYGSAYLQSVGVDAGKDSGGNPNFFYDECVVADAYIGVIPPALTEGDGIASDWTFRVSDNATAAYLIDSTGAILDSNSDPSVMINNGMKNCTALGGGGVYVYPDSYSTTSDLGGYFNQGTLTNVTLNLGGSTITRTATSGFYDSMFILNDWGTGTFNFTLTNGTLNANRQKQFISVNHFSNSTFTNLVFENGYSGGVIQKDCRFNVWENITLAQFAMNVTSDGGFKNNEIEYCNFTNIIIDGGTAYKTIARYGFYIGDWEPDLPYNYNESRFNIVRNMSIYNVRRDGIYLNSGALGYAVHNNTFTNCTLINNNDASYDAIKLRPCHNNTFTDITIINFTDAVTTGTSYLGSEEAGNCTGNYVQAQIYNATVTGLILCADDNNQEVSNNFFNLTFQNSKGIYVAFGTNSPVKNNVIYANFTNCNYGIRLEEGPMRDNTFYLNFSNCDGDGHSDIYHYSAWTEIVNNTFKVYATSGNPNGLMDFVNGTQQNFVYYPYVSGAPPSVNVFIVSPTNTTYSLPTVSVELYATGGTIDTILWNCTYTNGTVVYANTVYTTPTSMTLGDGNYIFNAAANNTLGTVGYSTVMFTVLIIVIPYDWGSWFGDWW